MLFPVGVARPLWILSVGLSRPAEDYASFQDAPWAVRSKTMETAPPPVSGATFKIIPVLGWKT